MVVAWLLAYWKGHFTLNSATMLLGLLITLVICSEVCSEKLIDLSHDLADDSKRWPDGPRFKKTAISKGYSPAGVWYEVYTLTLSEHTSTHFDAPSHMAYGFYTVDQIPISSLVAPAVVVDIQKKAAENSSYLLTTEDLMAWLEEHGPFPDGVVVFVRTGWGARYNDSLLYLGTDTDDPAKFVFPSISEGAAQLLTGYAAVSGRRVVGVGIDTPSIDFPTWTKVHVELFKNNIYALENVANLDKLPITGAEVTVMPMKIRGGSGGPCRILARIPDESAASRSVVPGLSVTLAVIFTFTFWRQY